MNTAMNHWIAVFVRRPVFTWVLVLVCVVLGIDGLGKMPVERFPNIDFPFVSVTVAAPGLSAEQAESEIATKIEGVLGTISRLERLDSISAEGVAIVNAQFMLDKNSADAANEVRDRVARITDELPPSARPAKIETFNLSATPILLVAIESPSGARTPIELSELADTVVRRNLQSIRGVGEVRLVGGATRALSVVLDPLRLRANDLTAQEVEAALGRENIEAPGGSLADGDAALGVRLSAKAHSAAELASVIVARRGNLSVRLGDLGRVEDAAIVSDSVASVGGRSAVVIAVTKQPGANTIAVADDVRSSLETTRRSLPDGVVTRIIQDNSEDIRASVHAVVEHLVIGAILAAVVVLLFLRSWRATLIAALAIPASVIGTFMVARALGMTLNLLSLLGLTLAVGIVIDDAIVVIENVVRVMQTRRLDAREAAVVATKEIALAVLATTLSLVAVFLPVATMEGIVGRYLAPFGLTMSASILLSMGIAFTLTPMLCSRWLKKPVAAREEHADAHVHDGLLERIYARALGWVLRRRWLSAVAIVVTIASIVPLGSVAPMTFLPIEDSQRVAVYVRLPESATVERTAQIGEEVAAKIRSVVDVRDTAMTTISQREATITAYLGRRGVQATTIQRVRADLEAAYAGKSVLVMVGPSDDFAAGPDSASIQYVVRGANLTELRDVTARLLAVAKAIPGTADHGVTTGSTGKPELSVDVDRALASQLGISQAEIGRALALLDRRGVDLGSIRDLRSRNDVSIKVRLRVADDALANEDLVRSITVRTDKGRLVPLAEIATLRRGEGPGIIRRVNRERQITLFMNTLPGTSDAAVIATLEAKMKELDPSGRYHGEVIGNAKEMEKAAAAFFVAIVLSFVFMYLVLAAQFESWVHPATILISLPLTIPFGLVSLVVGGQSLNLFSALGFLVLFGVVKKNSILQVDRILQLRADGAPRGEAILAACRDRLRPILMTTIAFVAGMAPLIVSSGAGAATNRAISVGILGGQTLSLALTLLVTPVVYTWFDDLQSWWKRRTSTKSAPNEVTPLAEPGTSA